MSVYCLISQCDLELWFRTVMQTIAMKYKMLSADRCKKNLWHYPLIYLRFLFFFFPQNTSALTHLCFRMFLRCRTAQQFFLDECQVIKGWVQYQQLFKLELIHLIRIATTRGLVSADFCRIQLWHADRSLKKPFWSHCLRTHAVMSDVLQVITLISTHLTFCFTT